MAQVLRAGAGESGTRASAHDSEEVEDMKEYRVFVNGAERTMLLDDEAAKELDAQEVEQPAGQQKQSDETSMKARKAVENK